MCYNTLCISIFASHKRIHSIAERKIAVKNKVIIILVVILCFIPTVVAVVNYKNTKDAPVDMSTAVSVSIDDISGRKLSFSKSSEDKDEAGQADALIRFFVQMNKNASSIPGLPDSLLGDKFYKVTLRNSADMEENFLIRSLYLLLSNGNRRYI